jgi:membrane-bound lytic murein transglycosylase B
MIALVLLLCPTFVFAGVQPDWPYAEKRMRKAGLKPRFIKNLRAHYETEHFAQVEELNLLLFLRKSDYHGVQVSPEAVADVRKFMKANPGAVRRASREHGVPGSVVASLLWLESRHGQNKGEFHVPSVYVHLVQSERLSVLQHLQASAKNFTSRVTAKARKEIAKRTKKKAEWALAELKAIQTMQQRNPKTVESLRGSFAGAFGMPQFIPSSFVKYAKSSEKKRPPDLVRADDAILSVAYYLKANGWKKARGSHVAALMKYNNSKDYANAILKLARFVDGAEAEDSKRLPASGEPGAKPDSKTKPATDKPSVKKPEPEGRRHVRPGSILAARLYALGEEPSPPPEGDDDKDRDQAPTTEAEKKIWREPDYESNDEPNPPDDGEEPAPSH